MNIKRTVLCLLTLLALLPGLVRSTDPGARAVLAPEAEPPLAERWEAEEARPLPAPLPEEAQRLSPDGAALLAEETTGRSGALAWEELTALDLAVERNWARQFTYDAFYEEAPSVTEPYAPGALTGDYLRTALAWLNYCRYAARLPGATLVSGWNELAQYGAVLLAATEELTAAPTRPSDMEQSFYALARSATGSSNLSRRQDTVADPVLSSLEGCLRDRTYPDALGNRRNLLNPLESMRVGFGQAHSGRGYNFILTRTFDPANMDRSYVDYDYVAWPAAGVFPTELLNTYDAWSVTLNPTLYRAPNRDRLTVTITREKDGAQWVLNKESGGAYSDFQNRAPFLVVNQENFGVNNCISFHPGVWGKSFTGTYTRYAVEIAGLERLNQETGAYEDYTLAYQVQFVNADQVELPARAVTVWSGAGGAVSVSSLGAVANQEPEPSETEKQVLRVTAGSRVHLALTPEEGYVPLVLVKGEAQQAVNGTVTLERVTEDAEVTVLFCRTGEDGAAEVSDGALKYVYDDGALRISGAADPEARETLTIPETSLGLPVTAGDAPVFASAGEDAVRVLNLSGGAMDQTLAAAWYQGDRFLGCDLVTLAAADRTLSWAEVAGPAEGWDSVRFFYVGSGDYVPLIPMTSENDIS